MSIRIDDCLLVCEKLVNMKKHSKKDIVIPCGLMLTGGIVMILQVADPVTVTGFVLVLVGALLLANRSFAPKSESK